MNATESSKAAQHYYLELENMTKRTRGDTFPWKKETLLYFLQVFATATSNETLTTNTSEYIQRKADQLEDMTHLCESVQLPLADPVFGDSGPLVEIWSDSSDNSD
ncbi:hypothetical protein TRICI_005109 [Trichomonascus ciferrii]|uniref:Uncharacterized protein n=1 Tax=Trichomonascus ciferrii TaxID=44093 RepID=A0A642V0X6_9ASCO|nr:hypothetical protein TRICI_005109 [Trichomonascus ciferrii]